MYGVCIVVLSLDQSDWRVYSRLVKSYLQLSDINSAYETSTEWLKAHPAVSFLFSVSRPLSGVYAEIGLLSLYFSVSQDVS